MKLSITGSSGFVGQNLVPYLNSSYNLIGRNELENMHPALLNDTEVVIHLAGKAHDLKAHADFDVYYHVNFELTKNLYDSFLKSDAKKFIFISSVKAVADHLDDDVLREDHIPNPISDYGRSKLMAEEYIQKQPPPDGKFYYILRPCMIHGPGNKGNLNLLYRFVKKGIPYPLAAFNNKRSFLSVENLCFIIKEIIESNCIESGIYNVSDDEALSTNNVVTILASAFDLKGRLWKIPISIIKFSAKLGDWFHLPLTSERLSKLTESYVVSNEKIKGVLKKKLPLTSIKGLEITANSFNKD